MQKPLIKQLNNKLKIVQLPQFDSRSVTVCLKGLGGSNYERDTEIGAAHLLEHWTLKGTEKYPSEELIKSLVTFQGGKFIAATSRDDVVFSVHVLSEDMENALEFLSQIFYFPNLDEVYLGSLKKVIGQEIVRYNDMPDRIALRRSYKLLYPKNRISFLNTGELSNVENLEKQTVLQFFKRNYTNNRFVLSLCGKYDLPEAEGLIEKYFSTQTSDSVIENIVLSQNTDLGVQVISKAGLANSYLKVDYYGHTLKDKKRFQGDLLAKYLDIMLKRELVELGGFSYKTSCDNFSANSYGTFSIYCLANEHELATVLGLIKQIISGSIRQIDHNAFLQAKNSYISSMIFNGERVSMKADLYATLLLHDILDQDEDNVIDIINGLTVNDLMETAKQTFSQNPKLTLITSSISESELKQMWLSY